MIPSNGWITNSLFSSGETLTGMTLQCQLTPATPRWLLVTAHAIPAQWVP
jgi:hypothetical protein